jgi:hypothetical protein
MYRSKGCVEGRRKVWEGGEVRRGKLDGEGSQNDNVNHECIGMQRGEDMNSGLSLFTLLVFRIDFRSSVFYLRK